MRDELIELADLRADQQRTEPDLAHLGDLQERKTRAFTVWADDTGDTNLRLEVRCAEQAAAARFQHQQCTGGNADGDGPAVARMLTVPSQGDHACSALGYGADHSPLSGAEARPLT